MSAFQSSHSKHKTISRSL